jgi:hypothetical protein
LVGEVDQALDGLADQIGRRHVPRGQEQVAVCDDLVLGESIALLLGTQHVADQVVARRHASLRNLVFEQRVERLLRGFDQVLKSS